MPQPAFAKASARVAVHPLATIFILALLVRLVNLAVLGGGDSFFAERDSLVYWDFGAELARPETFVSTLLGRTDRTPLYPLFVAGVMSIFGKAPWAVALLQTMLDAATCVMIGALGALISARVGIIAGVLAALSPTLIVFSGQILTDTLFLFFFAAMLLATARFLVRPTIALAMVAGLAGGLALATRPAIALLLAAAVPTVWVIAFAKQRNALFACVATLLFAVAAAAPVTPVLLRNALVYGGFGLSSQTGDHLAFWIVPLVTERANGTPYQVSLDRMDALYHNALAQRAKDAQRNPFVQSEVRSEVARREMAQLPLKAYAAAWLEGMAVNLAAPAVLADPRVRALPKQSFYNTPGAGLWQKARAYLFDDPGRYQLLLVAGALAMVPFLALEAIGFVMLARALPWAAAFAGAVIVYFLLISGPVAGPRYRMPMEPVLIVLAAIPLARLAERWSAAPEPS
jgi:hypothetical protein